MTTVRLRYTGELSVTFQHPSVGYVEQNAEFDVPEDEAETFTRRADIELVSGRRGRRKDAGDTGTNDDTGTGENPDGDTGGGAGQGDPGDPNPDA